MKGSVASTQYFPSLPTRTMSIGEVTLSILYISRYKDRKIDPEGDSDSKQWEENGWKLLRLRTNKQLETFLDYWAVKLNYY